MSIVQIVQAWRDEEFRSNLSASEMSALPNHPSGTIQLRDEDLANKTAPTFSVQLTQCTICCA